MNELINYLGGMVLLGLLGACICIAPILAFILSVIECQNWIIKILYFVWIAAEFGILAVIKDTKTKYASAITAAITYFIIIYSWGMNNGLFYGRENDAWGYIFFYCLTILPIKKLIDLIRAEKKKSKEQWVIREYNKNLEKIAQLDKDILAYQHMIDQQGRMVDVLSLLNGCGANVTKIEKNGNFRKVKDIQEKIEELENERKGVKVAIMEHEEKAMKQTSVKQ